MEGDEKMISLILMKKILSLFIIMFLGFVLVRLKFLKSEDSRVLSTICLYLVAPCAFISAFEVDITKEVVEGLLLAFLAAVIIHIVLLIMAVPLKRIFKMDAVELLSVIYSNSGNLIIPLVASILGSEWVVYSCAFVSVQVFFLWSHGKTALCEEKGIDLKKIFMNINMIAVFVGIIVFITGFRPVSFVQDAMDAIGSMIGPIAMLVTGMLIGGRDLKQVVSYKRMPLVVCCRLIIVPLITLCILKFTPLHNLASNGEMILLISLLATITPSASSITQMAVVYGKDADYASSINVISTILCIVTMPIIVMLYQI